MPISLNGIGIQPDHCKVINENGKLYIIPKSDLNDFIYLNGELILSKTEIFHNDRLILGTNTHFLVKIPKGKVKTLYFVILIMNLLYYTTSSNLKFL